MLFTLYQPSISSTLNAHVFHTKVRSKPNSKQRKDVCTKNARIKRWWNWHQEDLYILTLIILDMDDVCDTVITTTISLIIVYKTTCHSLWPFESSYYMVPTSTSLIIVSSQIWSCWINLNTALRSTLVYLYLHYQLHISQFKT